MIEESAKQFYNLKEKEKCDNSMSPQCNSPLGSYYPTLLKVTQVESPIVMQCDCTFKPKTGNGVNEGSDNEQHEDSPQQD